jgi:hypothetical protein
VVAAIEDRGHVTLPGGIGLNVNVPGLDGKRTAASYRFAFTQIGFWGTSGIRFAASDGTTSPATAFPTDDNPGSEANAFVDGNTVTVSPIQGTYQAPPDQAALVLTLMRGHFTSALAITDPKLVNVSARGFAGVGSAVQIVGFTVSGTATKTVLIRASGPALAAFGVTGALADPVVVLFDGANRLVATNDNWSDDAAKGTAIAAAAARIGAFAWVQGSKDAALLAALAPGPHTVVVRGVGGTTGVALIEVFDINSD